MLQKIVLKCSYNGGEKPNYNWGSLMHGILMELLPTEVTELLHVDNLRPFSQYILPMVDNQLEWHIGVWDDIVGDAIAKAVMPLSQIILRDKGKNIRILNISRNVVEERDFLSQFFTVDKPCRRYTLEFVTPCTHKCDDEYVLFPSPKLIIQSLHSRFSAFSQEFSLGDQEIMQQLIDHLRIMRYSLHSANFHLRGARITGYKGRINLNIFGPDQVARLIGMLLAFSEYSGVGIKTSLGMGGCRIEQTPINKEIKRMGEENE